ncbi:MAG: SCO family protein [Arenicella sp.]
MQKKTLVPIVLVALLAVVSGFILQQWSADNKSSDLPQAQTITWLTPGKPLVPFTLRDHKDQSFSIDRLQDKWTVMFFGFTNCPDICPTTMQLLKTVKDDLQGQNAWLDYQVVFMSVDPQRDDPAQLARYVPFFDSEFIGLTGEVADVQQFAKQMSMPFVIEASDDRGNYNVAHSASILLISPEAQLRGIISAPHEKELIAADLLALQKSLL